MENSKNEKVYFTKLSLYIIFGMAILLATSIILNVYFYAKSRIRVFDTNLGEKIEVEFSEQGTTIIANIVYPSNIVSGTKYNQAITLKTSDISTSYYVRAKAMYADYNIVNEMLNVAVSPSSNWVQNNNEYYYLTNILEDWESIPFIEELTLPIISTNVRNNTIISVVFEFVPTSSNVEKLWNISLDTILTQ